MLFSNERRLLSDYFGTNVYDQYGSTEVYSLAFECPTHAGSHVAADHVLLETAEDGRVLVTDFDNLAMPFIRYENGDVVEWKSRACPCGRASPLLARVLGRRSDIIRGPNGNRVHGEFFTHILEDWGWFERYRISQFQVVQERLNFIVVRLVVVSKPRPKDELLLTKVIREFLGDVEVHYEYPDVLSLNAAGKRRFTISQLEE
jgi:phenylacetate-CoA ligase